jgi:uncharacterized membrane protein
VDAPADAGAVPLVRDAAGGEVASRSCTGSILDEQKARNLRTGLVLASIALAFFIGIIVKYWMMSR